MPLALRLRPPTYMSSVLKVKWIVAWYWPDWFNIIWINLLLTERSPLRCDYVLLARMRWGRVLALRMCGRRFQCCEEVKDIAQISKVSLTRNDGVSDSSVYLIIVDRWVISYPGGKQNCTVLHEIYNLELLSWSQGREWF